VRTFAFMLLALAACGGSSSSSSSDPGVDAAPAAAPLIPQPTGTCPAIVNGDVMFSPAGMPPRMVKLQLDPAKVGNGPLILYWFATGSNPNEAGYALGATLNDITANGGIVASPYADSTAGQFEWFIVNKSTKLDDFMLADEVVACLAQAHMIDTTHIHSMGMSAGALQTTAVSFLRSNWIASVTTYSGGIPAGYSAPAMQNPANKFAAFIFDGGMTDNVFMVDFQGASQAYKAALDADGHFTAICDHNMGHSIPVDAAPSVEKFFADNGFGQWPSPYAAHGLPSGFPTYCAK
jgi:poly(3-hydroxybutyrate) depolymerase